MMKAGLVELSDLIQTIFHEQGLYFTYVPKEEDNKLVQFDVEVLVQIGEEAWIRDLLKYEIYVLLISHPDAYDLTGGIIESKYVSSEYVSLLLRFNNLNDHHDSNQPETDYLNLAKNVV